MADLDKLQRDDHDTLIRLEAKVDSLTKEIKNYAETVTVTLNDYGNRLHRLEMWRHDFALRWKMVLAVASVTGAAAATLINAAATYFGIHH